MWLCKPTESSDPSIHYPEYILKKFLLNENDLPEIKPLQVEVIDFGIGIPDSDLQNIFDPFITKKHDGKGLGLSIVSNSIRTLDGSIEVSSENGCTNFCLNFPLQKSEGLLWKKF